MRPCSAGVGCPRATCYRVLSRSSREAGPFIGPRNKQLSHLNPPATPTLALPAGGLAHPLLLLRLQSYVAAGVAQPGIPEAYDALPPHVFAMADWAYRRMMQSRKNMKAVRGMAQNPSPPPQVHLPFSASCLLRLARGSRWRCLPPPPPPAPCKACAWHARGDRPGHGSGGNRARSLDVMLPHDTPPRPPHAHRHRYRIPHSRWCSFLPTLQAQPGQGLDQGRAQGLARAPRP